MTHLTEEQLESILRGEAAPDEHLHQCPFCSDRLAEKQALADRLRCAFAGVEASEELAARVRRQTRLRVCSGESAAPANRRPVSRWRYWMAAAAALIAIPLLALLLTPSKAMAAEELARIHAMNMNQDHGFFSESDPAKLAGYFRRTLGFNPLLPKTHQGLALRGCCVKHFRGRETGSYVVDTPNGVMSVIVVTDDLDKLGMTDRFVRDGRRFGKSAFADNQMVAVRIGHFTYCAVGEVSHEYLTDLLSRLLADAEL